MLAEADVPAAVPSAGSNERRRVGVDTVASMMKELDVVRGTGVPEPVETCELRVESMLPMFPRSMAAWSSSKMLVGN